MPWLWKIVKTIMNLHSSLKVNYWPFNSTSEDFQLIKSDINIIHASGHSNDLCQHSSAVAVLKLNLCIGMIFVLLIHKIYLFAEIFDKTYVFEWFLYYGYRRPMYLIKKLTQIIYRNNFCFIYTYTNRVYDTSWFSCWWYIN